MGSGIAPEHSFCNELAMKIDDIDRVLSAIRTVSGLDEFVVIGSLSALGTMAQNAKKSSTSTGIGRAAE